MANILLFSIIMPLLISAFMIAYSTPLVIIRSKQWKKTTESTLELVIARIFIMLFFLIVPAIIILGSESAKEERKSLKRKNKEKDDLINTSQSSDFFLLNLLILISQVLSQTNSNHSKLWPIGTQGPSLNYVSMYFDQIIAHASALE